MSALRRITVELVEDPFFVLTLAPEDQPPFYRPTVIALGKTDARAVAALGAEEMTSARVVDHLTGGRVLCVVREDDGSLLAGVDDVATAERLRSFKA